MCGDPGHAASKVCSSYCSYGLTAAWGAVCVTTVWRSPREPNQHNHSKAAIGPACSPASPYLRCELLPLFLGRVVDDLPPGVVRTSGVLKGGLGVLGEVAGSGVVLARAAANPGAGHCEP